MKRGNSLEIPREIVRQIVLQYVASKEGMNVLDLMNRADVHFLDGDDRDVPLDSVAIAWE